MAESMTLPVDEAAEYRVELYLPTRRVLRQTTSPAPVPSVVFDIYTLSPRADEK